VCDLGCPAPRRRINVGSFLFAAEYAPARVIQIPVFGKRFWAPGGRFWRADRRWAGPRKLANYGLPPGTPGPSIAQIDFGAGTVLSVPGAQQFHSPRQHSTSLVHQRRFLGNSPASVTANGMFSQSSTIRYEETSRTASFGSAAQECRGRDWSPPNGYSHPILPIRFANLTINNGSITIIPANRLLARQMLDGNLVDE